jgi:hypothetical protein
MLEASKITLDQVKTWTGVAKLDDDLRVNVIDDIKPEYSVIKICHSDGMPRSVFLKEILKSDLWITSRGLNSRTKVYLLSNIKPDEKMMALIRPDKSDDLDVKWDALDGKPIVKKSSEEQMTS